METRSTWSLSEVKFRLRTAFNKQDGFFLIPLPSKPLRKLLLRVSLTEVTQLHRSVISMFLGESKTWRLKSPPTMSKTEGISDSGRQERSAVDNSSGLDKHPTIAGLNSVGPTIFPPITLLQLLTWKEMRSALTWKKQVWSERNLTEHLLLPFCMRAMGGVNAPSDTSLTRPVF